MNQRLRANIAVFYNDYQDLQTNAYDPALGVNLRTIYSARGPARRGAGGTDAQCQTRSYGNALNDDIQGIPKQTLWNASARYISGDGHWTTALGGEKPARPRLPQAVGYIPSSGQRYYSINHPRTVLVSVRYDL